MQSISQASRHPCDSWGSQSDPSGSVVLIWVQGRLTIRFCWEEQKISEQPI